MAHPQSKLPRRHAQRQALNHGRAKTPLPSTPSHKHLRAYRRPAKKKQRSSASISGDDSSSDSDSDSDHDSGYNSASGLESKAEHYLQIQARFRAAGPTMSDPGDSAEKMMRAEERRWEL